MVILLSGHEEGGESNLGERNALPITTLHRKRFALAFRQICTTVKLG